MLGRDCIITHRERRQCQCQCRFTCVIFVSTIMIDSTAIMTVSMSS